MTAGAKVEEIVFGAAGSYGASPKIWIDGTDLKFLDGSGAAIKLEELRVRGAVHVSELAGLETDFAGQYYNPERLASYINGTGIPALINLSGTADVGGNLTLKAHVEDVSIHQRPSAYVVRVAKSGGDFTTITAALASLPANSDFYTILVAPGTYTEAVTISRNNVSLIAVGAVRIENSATAITVSSTVTNVLIDGFVIVSNVNSNNVSIKFDNASACLVRNCEINYSSGPNPARVVLLTNACNTIDFVNCKIRGYVHFAESSNGTLTGCEFQIAVAVRMNANVGNTQHVVRISGCYGVASGTNNLLYYNGTTNNSLIYWDYQGWLSIAAGTYPGVTFYRWVVERSLSIGDVTGLQTALDAKSAVGHGHTIANITDLQTTLDAKVPTSRTLTAGTGLTGGGDGTANRTIALDANSQDAVAKRHSQNTDVSTNAAWFSVLGSFYNENFDSYQQGYRAGDALIVWDSELEGIRFINYSDLTSSIPVSGTFHGSHIGNGQLLTALNATQLTSGTLPDARLSSNVARRDLANTFSQQQTFNGGAVLAGQFTLNAAFFSAGASVNMADNTQIYFGHANNTTLTLPLLSSVAGVSVSKIVSFKIIFYTGGSNFKIQCHASNPNSMYNTSGAFVSSITESPVINTVYDIFLVHDVTAPFWAVKRYN